MAVFICPRIDLDGERDDVDRTARDRGNGRGSGGLVVARSAQRARHSSPRDAGIAICDREFADLRRDVPKSCELMCSSVSRFSLLSRISASSSCAGGVRHCHDPIAPGATLSPRRSSSRSAAGCSGTCSKIPRRVSHRSGDWRPPAWAHSILPLAEEGAGRGALILEKFGSQEPGSVWSRSMISIRRRIQSSPISRLAVGADG